MRNPNHPKKGSNITVQPIRDIKDIDSIKRLLSKNTRDLLLFTIGINNGLRCGDILKLKVSDVKHLKPNDTLTIREQKTGKDNVLMINKTSYKILRDYLSETRPSDDDYIFKSRKGDNESLSVEYVNSLVKGWTRSINLHGNFGTHSLRKTFGYIQRKKFGVSWEVLCKRFNHSSPSVTMRYLGIEDREVNGILMNEI
ncbi:MAG: tyrosine-type recombinase/integrase [Syntrophus sp. (in: bacteria)]